MTDEQIINGLERCFARGFDESTCYECPFYTATAKCTEDLRISAVDLINRQKAEIGRLKMVIEQIENDLNPLPFETNFEKATQQIKSEAIKEFAERLKKYLCLNLREGISVVTVTDIDKLVKEMTEGL